MTDQQPAVNVSSFEALGALHDTITALARNEAAQREAKISAALTANGFTVIRTEPVEEAAAEPDTVARLRAEFAVRPETQPAHNWGALSSSYGTSLSVITDASVPPGEIHLRPRSRAHAEPERPAGWCPTCEGQPRQATS
ncbi:hypothetical protein [Kitasatospora indigofera]|uniref:hypothetical protein n=1 Tax=Kitasatospora indigofera TaxID=67307 RepID=UPI0036A64EBE